MVETVEHTCLLTQSRTDATSKLRKGVGGAQQSECRFPLALIQGIVPLRSLVAQRTSPVAERHSAIHAT